MVRTSRPSARRALGRLTAALGAIGALAVVFAGAASAHVHLEPDAAPKGGNATVSFIVPNEEDAASTVKVEVQVPTDHPIGTVSVQAIPGWTSTVEKTTLAKPIQTDDGEITETVSKITWEGGTIAPDEFQEFTVSLDSLPDDTDSIVLKTLQTYSNGDVVRWIDEPTAGGAEPEHPAPVLQLTAASSAADHHGSTATTTTTHDDSGSSEAAGGVTHDDSNSGSTLGTIGIVVGAVALVVALIAVFRKPRSAQ